MESCIVDTNVLLVAGKQHQDVSVECVAACASRLSTIMASGKIIIDDGFEIVREYLHKNNPNSQKTAGDYFAKWVLQNRTNTERCAQVHLEKDGEGNYSSFPNHPSLGSFDPPDKKFVAVAAAHPGHPPILEAADSKWLDWAPALAEFGLTVDFVCAADLQRFHKKKFGS